MDKMIELLVHASTMTKHIQGSLVMDTLRFIKFICYPILLVLFFVPSIPKLAIMMISVDFIQRKNSNPPTCSWCDFLLARRVRHWEGKLFAVFLKMFHSRNLL